MPTKVEEILVDADIIHAERTLPDTRDAFLQLRDRRVEVSTA